MSSSSSSTMVVVARTRTVRTGGNNVSNCRILHTGISWIIHHSNNDLLLLLFVVVAVVVAGGRNCDRHMVDIGL